MASDWEVVGSGSGDWQQVNPQQTQAQQSMQKLPGWMQGLVGLSQGAGDLARSLGLGAAPDLLSQSAPMQAVQKLTGINPLASEQQVSQMQANPLARAGEDVAGAASWMVPGVEAFKGAGILGRGANAALTGALKGELYGTSQGQPTNLTYPIGGAILGPILSTLLSGKVNQSGVVKAMTAAKDEATAQGASKGWEDIASQVRRGLQEGQYKYRPDFAKEVERILSKRTPAPITVGEKSPTLGFKSPNMTANDLHDLRQALDKSIPKSMWANPNVRPIGAEANQFVRKYVSDALHKVAPKTEFLDSLYHLYSLPGVGRGTFPILGNVKYPQQFAGLPSIATDAIVSLLGIDIAKKLGFGL